MSAKPASPFDVRLWAAVAVACFAAALLSALFLRRPWGNTATVPARFLGLDEPVEPLRPGR